MDETDEWINGARAAAQIELWTKSGYYVFVDSKRDKHRIVVSSIPQADSWHKSVYDYAVSRDEPYLLVASRSHPTIWECVQELLGIIQSHILPISIH